MIGSGHHTGTSLAAIGRALGMSRQAARRWLEANPRSPSEP